MVGIQRVRASLQKRVKETAYEAILTDCINLVNNGMRKKEECLSLRREREREQVSAFRTAWFYFQLKGSDSVSGEWF